MDFFSISLIRLWIVRFYRRETAVHAFWLVHKKVLASVNHYKGAIQINLYIKMADINQKMLV
jgi:hypothetical protein